MQALLAPLLALLLSTARADLLLRRELSHHPLAVCNDGTAAVYYSPDPAPSYTRAVLYLQDSFYWIKRKGLKIVLGRLN